MELTIIYNLLQKAQTLEEFMLYNNAIIQIEEEQGLTNYRKDSKIDQVKSGKNKILGFINRKTK